MELHPPQTPQHKSIVITRSGQHLYCADEVKDIIHTMNFAGKDALITLNRADGIAPTYIRASAIDVVAHFPFSK